ncbi:hypothetical protein CYLTODRAFT_422036 [Cylindrobasidium torrendii FP15055 ss-10]|uniref:Ricin B lectin domain-containing protein n=1 Tax=Cylindrobasidium torrendii FP15055 ss-10 TaxID=1314674 RepID=A0A0D7BBU1_9AGAR|nr:hypothetical protein CYLTODRAFT_422036 [Cylindrobasidium torrendii FP15055 ss-10]
MSVTHGRTPKLVSGVYRIINEASQSTIRVHQHAQPLLLSYRYELLGVFEQWELTVQDKGSYELRCMGLTLGQVGIENGVCIINGGNPVTFDIDSIGDGLYTVKAPGDGQYWGIEQSPTRQKPEVAVKLASAPSADGEFESTQLWRFERLDDDASHH